MYDLESIVAQNKRAEELGIMKAGEAVGTTGHVPGGLAVAGVEAKPHIGDTSGLRGHSVGDHYPWSVQPFIGDYGNTMWRVVNYESGFKGVSEHETYALAEDQLIKLRDLSTAYRLAAKS